jgi:hypothetical protein
MPTRSRRENEIIRIFLSAYENDSWADSEKEWLDEELDGAVEVLATRTSDGLKLAIEHTIIQPFDSDKLDFARFAPVFLPIEQDNSLAVPERATYVYIPVGTLKKGTDWTQFGKATHAWLQDNAKSLPNGESQHSFRIRPDSGSNTSEISLNLRVVNIPGFVGKLFVRRSGPIELGKVVNKALTDKVQKLVKTKAGNRILLLERDQFPLDERRIYDEIEKQRSIFPELTNVDEIWFAETVFLKSEGIVEFNRYENGELVQSLSFANGQLHLRVENGVGFVVNRL